MGTHCCCVMWKQFIHMFHMLLWELHNHHHWQHLSSLQQRHTSALWSQLSNCFTCFNVSHVIMWTSYSYHHHHNVDVIMFLYVDEHVMWRIDVKTFYVVVLFSNKNAFLTFFLFSQRFLLLENVGQQFQLHNMQLRETRFFDVWTEQWLRKYLSIASVHNLFTNVWVCMCQF